MPATNWDRVPIDAQAVEAPLSRAAVFLVVAVDEGSDALATTCGVLGGLDNLAKTVGFRDLSSRLSCIAGLGSDFWGRLGAGPRPHELKPFVPIEESTHSAPATPSDLLFHIRAERPDMCFEFARLLLDALGAAVTVLDEAGARAASERG